MASKKSSSTAISRTLERPEYKFDCDCRKPKPGLLQQAAKDFNIDLSQSVMIGDGDNDVLAGNYSGCQKSIKILDESLSLGTIIKDILK